MNQETFMAERKKLLKLSEEQKKELDKKYTTLLKSFLKENCDYEVGQVVNVFSKKKPERLAIYDIQVKYFDDLNPMIVLCGWYLDVDNSPVRWNGGIWISGIANPTKVSLSDNQKHLPVNHA